MPTARVVGGGLAGCEAAWQLARRGIPVELTDMKPDMRTPAHQSPALAELVCSNSLRSDQVTNAAGLLKEEMRQLGSLIISAADNARVPAGSALAVDRAAFSGAVMGALAANPLVTIRQARVDAVPPPPCVVATGPLTDGALAAAVAAMPGVGTLHFFDAAAPIVTLESLDLDKMYRAGRYGRGEDYLNCPMDKAQYEAFVAALLSAQTAPVHEFDGTQVFEGCMPVESMAARGPMALAFGPMKPVGLRDPRTGKGAFAVVQLRQDDAAATLYNLVGFQTRLKFGEQRRVFGMIPGLGHAVFARYGVMHRNTFLRSPGVLDANYQMIARPGLYFAGQMTGVEGYVESAASGLVAGLSLARSLLGLPPVDFTRRTAIGALARYVATPNTDFQPMHINFGLLDAPGVRAHNKQRRYEHLAARALDMVEALRSNPLAADFSPAG
ncbi:MAG: methylenetetrahydrofolate--tRNA-(uracil(54)-C(5))-methyltransferase (FADH(2)-oxidizing) TrmFO [Oscillospiraceae bacterium]|jgi:methylenetetrahydrofolate--tRNA-(uracil-5-)-methyltransferase|nr:methylenetetrahydrofolate--tRNA-(uracil(54)-C(5))-methyltransferase (FADH(2)-oxidizing) TrmFO [Oscillospiraceae bacterium]